MKGLIRAKQDNPRAIFVRQGTTVQEAMLSRSTVQWVPSAPIPQDITMSYCALLARSAIELGLRWRATATHAARVAIAKVRG